MAFADSMAAVRGALAAMQSVAEAVEAASATAKRWGAMTKTVAGTFEAGLATAKQLGAISQEVAEKLRRRATEALRRAVLEALRRHGITVVRPLPLVPLPSRGPAPAPREYDNDEVSWLVECLHAARGVKDASLLTRDALAEAA
jgi:hypothetical protein